MMRLSLKISLEEKIEIEGEYLENSLSEKW